MIWGAMTKNGTAGLYFLTPGTTMNGSKYVDLLKTKLLLHMSVHNTSIFMQDGAPCHRSKIVKKFLGENNVVTLDWPGNSPDLNPIENLWSKMKDLVAEKQPSSGKALTETIKEVWVKKISREYCMSLIASMPRRLKAVVTVQGIKIKSNLHYTRRITPKRVTSCGAHLRGLAPGLHSSEETPQRWRVVGDTVPI